MAQNFPKAGPGVPPQLPSQFVNNDMKSVLNQQQQQLLVQQQSGQLAGNTPNSINAAAILPSLQGLSLSEKQNLQLLQAQQQQQQQQFAQQQFAQQQQQFAQQQQASHFPPHIQHLQQQQQHFQQQQQQQQNQNFLHADYAKGTTSAQQQLNNLVMQNQDLQKKLIHSASSLEGLNFPRAGSSGSNMTSPTLGGAANLQRSLSSNSSNSIIGLLGAGNSDFSLQAAAAAANHQQTHQQQQQQQPYLLRPGQQPVNNAHSGSLFDQAGQQAAQQKLTWNNSGMSDTSENGYDMLRTLLKSSGPSNDMAQLIASGQLNALALRKNGHGGMNPNSGMGISSFASTSMQEMNPQIMQTDRKRRSPEAQRSNLQVHEKKQQLGVITPRIHSTPPPVNLEQVLERPIIDSSLEEIVAGMQMLRQGHLPQGASQPAKTLASVVTDTVQRQDRFHKKKSSADIVKTPLKLLKSKAYSAGQANSSGQGCTIVVLSRKCTKHAKGKCDNNLAEHKPSDFLVSREPITRSNFGKWLNCHIAAINKKE